LYPSRISFFFGIGAGGEGKIELPSPALNILDVNEDYSGNVIHESVFEK
jgi:hypothetical protein